MLQQVLRMIDIFGILRKPSWDGVRVLLMTLPLTAEVQPPMERLVSKISRDVGALLDAVPLSRCTIRRSPKSTRCVASPRLHL